MYDQPQDTGSLWHAYNRRLYGFILAKVKNPALAEDILQEVFLKAHINLSAVRESNKAESWLFSIARNSINDHFRSENKNRNIPMGSALAEPADTNHNLLFCCLKHFIPRLPEKYRAPLIARMNDIDVARIAASNGIGISGVRSRLSRARAMLRRYFRSCCNPEFDKYGNLLEADFSGCHSC